METSRRNFVQSSALILGASLTSLSVAGKSLNSNSASPQARNLAITGQSSMEDSNFGHQIPEGTSNVLGGDVFDPSKWLVVPPMTFRDLKIGDVFRAPSRTLTAAHTSEFQAVSADTHPRHYNDEYAKAHGMPAALVQPFQLLGMTAPGATLFTHYVGESIVALSEVACRFQENAYVGDTMYPALEIQELTSTGNRGFVTMAIVIYNQNGQVVLSGHQKFVLKLA